MVPVADRRTGANRGNAAGAQSRRLRCGGLAAPETRRFFRCPACHAARVRGAGGPASPNALHGVKPVFKRVDTCAAEFQAATAYMYSTYEEECEAAPSDRPKIMVLGGGPNRIGQGIEFDYCCVHAALAMRGGRLRDHHGQLQPGDGLHRLRHLGPSLLRAGDAGRRARHRGSRSNPKGSSCSSAARPPSNWWDRLHAAGVPIIGTSPDAIDRAEDRERFQAVIEKVGLRQPSNRTAVNVDDAVRAAAEIGYPIVVRPSYVLGGRAMEIVYNAAELTRYFAHAVDVSFDSPVLLDRFLEQAVEVDVDAVSDGDQVRDRRHHAAHRAGRRPFRRLRVRAAAVLPLAGASGRNPTAGGGDGGGTRRRGTYERAACDPGQRRLCAGGEPARIPYRAVRLQVHRRVLGQGGGALHGRDDARRAGVHGGDRSRLHQRQGVGVSVSQVPGRGSHSGPRDEVYGRGDGASADTFAEAFAKASLGAGDVLPKGGTAFVSVKPSDRPFVGEVGRPRSRTSASGSWRPAGPPAA